MTQDASKVQNGTLRCVGTNDPSLNFDARKVGEVYTDFKGLVRTIRRNISSRDDVHAFVTSIQKGNKAVVCVVCEDDEDETRLKEELLSIVQLCRNRAASHKAHVYLRFIKPLKFETIQTYEVPWDDVKEARELKLKEEIQVEGAE